jgi:hypothetical protein
MIEPPIETIWVVRLPGEVRPFGPVLTYTEDGAAHYKQMGFKVEGPYDLRPPSCPVVARSPHAQPDECGIITGDETWCLQPEGHSGPHKLA